MKKTDILFVSHFYPYKNLELLVHAFQEFSVCSDNDTTSLFICGRPAFKGYFEKVKELVNKNRLKAKVHFTGSINHDDLRVAYSKCKLFVFPSLCESSGYTLTEAGWVPLC